jgi:hypothetical protein
VNLRSTADKYHIRASECQRVVDLFKEAAEEAMMEQNQEEGELDTSSNGANSHSSQDSDSSADESEAIRTPENRPTERKKRLQVQKEKEVIIRMKTSKAVGGMLVGRGGKNIAKFETKETTVDIRKSHSDETTNVIVKGKGNQCRIVAKKVEEEIKRIEESLAEDNERKRTWQETECKFGDRCRWAEQGICRYNHAKRQRTSSTSSRNRRRSETSPATSSSRRR